MINHIIRVEIPEQDTATRTILNNPLYMDEKCLFKHYIG